MGYFYEELGPDRFQELAQTLILAGHPKHIVQCLPTGQPDGGRDGIAFFSDPDETDFFVFQVKFSRNPEVRSERDAVEALIKTESKKIEKLIQQGAKRYFFITNVKGTAHLDVGSIDKVNKMLSEEFGIPTEVWWRDDLDRRIDQSSDIKWSFIDICRASDLMQFLLSSSDSSEKLEAKNAVTAYMAQQYAADRDVKFKQVDLKCRLTELFVDLPIGLKRPMAKEWRGFTFQAVNANDIGEYTAQLEQREHFDDEGEIPFRHQGQAASFLLQMPLFKGVTRIVLEGSPGQGKSTVTQFVSQLNRLRLTKKDAELNQVSSLHCEGPVRAPFRVDLRDYARWITGYHPFSKGADSLVPPDGQRSLESFLAMQVGHFAGGLKIDHQELVEFFKLAHSVAVLDGFDEVADIATRGRVVDEICKAADRLDGLALSIQIIVTSRPTAFANSPGFPESDWSYLELKDLRPKNIEAYRDKWSVAHGLSEDERASVENTLGEKLEQPHLRELARNPMQLAILLHLIHVQGHALPDKRTTLYEEYMKLFFNREAEKSAIVRDHRDLLLAIHGVLAWRLQTQAEEGSGAGSMTREELKNCVRNYLESEEYDISLAEKLVRGTMERVGALVSRVEGTFEFEVQPLREYFTAWHLYKTANYSPAGAPKMGTKPDRFDALARSSYWTNVTRFYCGFYDKGELGSLIDGFIQLTEENGYALVNQPRQLAIMLLSDQVFAQSPRGMKQLIAHLVKEPGFQRLIASGAGIPQRSLGLPEMAGRGALLEACIEKLDTEQEALRRVLLRRVIAENMPKKDLKSFWYERYTNKRMVCDPVREARDYRIAGDFTTSEIRDLSKDDNSQLLRWFAEADFYEEIIADKGISALAQEEFFAGRLSFPIRHYSSQRTPTSLELLTETLNRAVLARNFAGPERHPHRLTMIHHSLGISMRDIQEHDANRDSTGEFAARIVALVLEHRRGWSTRWGLWEELVDSGFAHVPQAAIFIRAALISTAVDEFFAFEEEDSVYALGNEDVNLPDDAHNTNEGAEEDAVVNYFEPDALWSDEGFAPTKGLVGRLQFARARANDAAWWAVRFDHLGDEATRLIRLAAFLLWASPSVIAENRIAVDTALEELEAQEWSRLAMWIKDASYGTTQIAEPFTKAWLDVIPQPGMRLSFALVKRFKQGTKEADMHRSIGRLLFYTYDGEDPHILREAANLELMYEGTESTDWGYVSRLSILARRIGIPSLTMLSSRRSFPVPPEVAKAVLAESECHCGQWVAICERAYQSEIAQAALTVSSIAEGDRWFVEG